MLAFISRRLVDSIILLLVVSFISFALVRMDISLPAWHYNLRWGQQQILDISSPETRISAGDPLSDLRLNPSISRETIASEEKRLGLNKSFIEQYWSWLSNILRGDFGYAQNQRKVIDLIKPALLNTFILNILALLCTWIVAISLGIIAALKAHSRLDLGLAVFCTLTMSLPSFVLAIFALFVALQTGLPIGGLSSALKK